ncbi:MAG TPA: carboxy-S-adenosyl-L-methionine synthase CmoA [Gammaproteobacteria bacterium]|nr:carboxy-S-adenosyl-L-methionine synthase CmoA [Gammaproteobacteria bacterium]
MSTGKRPESADDRLYSRPLKKVADFVFDDTVARVFPDMIERSVPGYAALVPLIGMLVERYMQPGARCYDLGCSLGAVSLAVARFLKSSSRNLRDCRIVAIDNSSAMVERCRKNLYYPGLDTHVEVICADIQTVDIEDAAVAVLNFTLQFIEPERRGPLVGKLFSGLRPGGAMILSEKIAAEPLLQELHLDFKKANGYSELEIAQKRTALEKVLIPESIDTHIQRLQEAGFSQVRPWFQCLNFVSLLAIK